MQCPGAHAWGQLTAFCYTQRCVFQSHCCVHLLLCCAVLWLGCAVLCKVSSFVSSVKQQETLLMATLMCMLSCTCEHRSQMMMSVHTICWAGASLVECAERKHIWHEDVATM